MFDRDNWQEIWNTITRNKVRSLLTGFGVFWGVLMLIILVGIGNGFRDGIYNIVGGFASNSIFFETNRTSEAYKGYRKGRWWQMEMSDLDMLRAQAQSVDEISPIIWGRWSDKNTVRGLKSGNYGSRGVYPAHFRIEQMDILQGRLISDIDIEQKRKVCVIGKEVYETLFNIGEDPLGKYIRVNGIYFYVVGVIRPKSNISIGGNVERSVFMPFTTMQQTFKRGDKFWFLACTAKKGYSAAVVEEEVKALIKAAHDVSPTDEKAMWSFNIEEEFKRFEGLGKGVEVLIWIVGLGALLSGVFGISNIMLVTVRERMREIGVKRALGATPLRIITQIMSESVVLTAIAGMIGLLCGIGVIAVIQNIMEMSLAQSGQPGLMMPPTISFDMAIGALFILVLSGVVAGILPTLKALRVKAIDAIRDE